MSRIFTRIFCTVGILVSFAAFLADHTIGP
jgi:hypothetical protein